MDARSRAVSPRTASRSSSRATPASSRPEEGVGIKILFLPFSILGGLFAGQLSKKIFDFIWGRFDEEDAPRPKHRRIALPKLALALIIEGALFRLVKGLVDHATRQGFSKATGSWPGEEEPEPA